MCSKRVQVHCASIRRARVSSGAVAGADGCIEARGSAAGRDKPSPTWSQVLPEARTGARATARQTCSSKCAKLQFALLASCKALAFMVESVSWACEGL